jgi:hypothetical protein
MVLSTSAYKKGGILFSVGVQPQASPSYHQLSTQQYNHHILIAIMRFTQIATLLSVAAAASAQYTFNITQAEKPGNMEKYKCL